MVCGTLSNGSLPGWAGGEGPYLERVRNGFRETLGKGGDIVCAKARGGEEERREGKGKEGWKGKGGKKEEGGKKKGRKERKREREEGRKEGRKEERKEERKEKKEKKEKIDEDTETLEPSSIARANVKLLWRPVWFLKKLNIKFP